MIRDPMPLVTAIFRGILRAFRGDLSLAPACRWMVRCAGVVVFVAAALGALPANAQSDPFAQPGGVSKPSAPIILHGHDYVAVPNYVTLTVGSVVTISLINFAIKWTRPENSGGGRILEYRITRSKAALSLGQDPARCDLLSESVLPYVADSYEAFVGPDVFEFADETTDIPHGNCVRWHISARNAAGWGAVTVTNPLLTRAGRTDVCGGDSKGVPPVPIGIASDTKEQILSCTGSRDSEASDWCRRGNGKLIWNKTAEEAGAKDREFWLICKFPFEYGCDGRYPRRYDGANTTCGLSRDVRVRSYCGTYSNYNLRHRECICARLTEVESVTEFGHTPPNIAGEQACGCKPNVVANPIAGIDTGTCRCPAGEIYYPDTHACALDVGKNFDANPIDGEKTVENGVVQINHTRSAIFVLTIMVPDTFLSHPGWMTVQVGDSATPLCTGRFFHFSTSGGKRFFRATCPQQGPGVTIPAGKHDIAAKFQVSGHDFVAPLKVHVGTDRQGECERKNPAVNPVGGRYEPGDGTCELDRDAFYKTLGNPANGNVPRCFTDTDHASVSTNCVRHYAELRAAGCNPPETLHKQGSANHLPSVSSFSDYSCVCADTGEPTKEDGSCYSDEEKALVAEFEREPLDLVSVVALLDQGVNPNLVSGGVPLLFVAATLGDAEAVSILITAGADPNAQIPNISGGGDYLPEYLGHNGLTGIPATAQPILPWRSAASVLIYFGDAARLSTVTYDWARARPNAQGEFSALAHLGHRYVNFNSLKLSADNQEAAELMAGYMLDQGMACPSAYTSHAICTSRLTCSSVSGGQRAHCGGCPGRPYRSAAGNSCVESCDAVKERVTTDAHWLDPSCACASEYDLIPDPATGNATCGKRLFPEQALFLDAALVGRPGAPTVALSWQTPTNEGPELTHYEFWHGFAPSPNPPDCSQANFGVQLDSPSTAFPGVVGGRTEAKQSVVSHYGQCAVYRIAGVNALGTASYLTSDRLYIQHAPGAPGAVAVSLLVNSRVSLFWSPVSEANRLGAVISGYEVLRKVDGGDFVSVGFSPRTSYVDDFPPLGAMVRYQARAQSSAGAGALSGESPALEIPGERINYDEALEDELAKATPSLATVLLYLSSGGNANVTINGVAALLSAAEKGRADLVRALVLAGADVNARHPGVFNRNVAHLMAHNRVGEGKDEDLRLGWGTARDVLLAFGNALAQRGALFNWDASDNRGGRPLEYFYDNYLPASSDDRAVMERMANYMIARGASCRESVKTAQADQPDLCDGSPGPGAPDVFSAELGGAMRTRVTLSWSAPFANAAPVTGYKFWRVGGAPAAGKSDCADYVFPLITPSTPTVAIAVASPSALTAVDSLGTAGYGHCYRYGIAAINANGEGAIAESAGFYVQFKPVTLAPPRVSVGLDRVPVVSWDRLTNRVTERRGAVIEKYLLQRRTGANGTWENVIGGLNIAQSESSYREQAANIAAGATYYYRIRALSSAGLGDYSGPSSAAVISSSGICDIGKYGNTAANCQVIGDSCVVTARMGTGQDPEYDKTVWRARNGQAVCECPDGYEYLDATGKRYCARSGEPGEPQAGNLNNPLGDIENPAMIQKVIEACTSASYTMNFEYVLNRGGGVLGRQTVCDIHTQRATPQGLAEARSECILATQQFEEDSRLRDPTYLLAGSGALFCHHVFPRLEGTQASVGVIPSGHNAANPYVYGECPPGQDLSRELNRCRKNCSSGPNANLGRGEVSGLEWTQGSSAEEDSCACPSGEFLKETACVSACPNGERTVTDEDGLTSCLDVANVGNAQEQCGDGRIVGTYAAGNLAVLCPVGRDINALDAETVYTSEACWLSASPGFKAALPSPTDPNHIPSCADLAAGETNPPLLPDLTTGTDPISFGDCPEGKALDSGANCECEDAEDVEQGSHCFKPSGAVIPEDADKAALRELCEGAFRGKAEDAGNGQLVCSQVDANDTFCILGSDDAFPCEGLFRHVRDCNFSGRPDKQGRRALNPFWCGSYCELGYAAGDECVFTSKQFQKELGATAESLRATVAVAEGHRGAVYTVNFARTVTNAPPVVFTAEEPRLYFVTPSNGIVGALPANSGDARSSVALLRVAHAQDARVYFSARVFLDWVDAPQYATLTHVRNPMNSEVSYTIPAKPEGDAHALLTVVQSGNGYVLKNIWKISGGQRIIEAEGEDAETRYRVSNLTGSISPGTSGENGLRPGTYELEVHFTNSARMVGTLTLRIPVVVTN